jgi:hypothetical protein
MLWLFGSSRELLLVEYPPLADIGHGFQVFKFVFVNLKGSFLLLKESFGDF